MATDDWLHDLFGPVGPVSVRKMFGGSGIYRDGRMFALVADGEVFLKSDAASAKIFADAGCQPSIYVKKGQPVETSYRRLPEDAADDPELLRFWVGLACEAASRAGEKSRKKRKTR